MASIQKTSNLSNTKQDLNTVEDQTEVSGLSEFDANEISLMDDTQLKLIKARHRKTKKFLITDGPEALIARLDQLIKEKQRKEME